MLRRGSATGASLQNTYSGAPAADSVVDAQVRVTVGDVAHFEHFDRVNPYARKTWRQRGSEPFGGYRLR